MLEDYSGVKATHKATDELIPKTTLASGFAVLSKGAFFGTGLVLINAITRIPLTVNRDYKLRVLDSAATGHSSGKAVYTLIEILTTQTTDVLATYQYVGGYHVEQREVILRLLSTFGNEDISKIYYSQLKNKPVSFDVTEEHLHDASQVTGKDAEIAALNSITQSLERIGDNVALGHENELIKYIRDRLLSLTDRADSSEDILGIQTKFIEELNANYVSTTESIITTQTSLVGLARRLMSVEIQGSQTLADTIVLLTRLDESDSNQINQTLSIIDNQTSTIKLSHSVMSLSERIRQLENS